MLSCTILAAAHLLVSAALATIWVQLVQRILRWIKEKFEEGQGKKNKDEGIGGSKAGAPGLPSDVVHSLIDRLWELENNSCIWVIPPQRSRQNTISGGSTLVEQLGT
ncbi:hypothetical protein ACLB2K_037006 [Fragaria x ananassa]